MDDFYAARSGTIPPLPWTNFAPPLSRDGDTLKLSIEGPAGRAAYNLERLEQTLFAGCSGQGYWLPYQIAIRFVGEGGFDAIRLTTGRTKSLRLSRSSS